ncbi:MAG: hypothetical protein E6Q71_01280 [Pseudomonas sp.]|nr:MAG: hypothetical protein E6Q71_01280 [Pseudomonas sp.]
MPVKKGTKHNGRSSDITFSWLTADKGPKWEKWRSLMAGWIATQHKGLHAKIHALMAFSTKYLPRLPDGFEPAALFKAVTQSKAPDLATILGETMGSSTVAQYQNVIVDFIDWVIEQQFSEPDDRNQLLPLVANPFSKAQTTSVTTETVHNPLPYAYIQELRQILCPQPDGSFSDWHWAQQQYGQGRTNGTSSGNAGDWFEVDSSLIDLNDADCVWRTRVVTARNGKQIEKHEIWSPVRSVALLVKLHLPLRTYQVRFLDSGEADTWRYQQGDWVLNEKHRFAHRNEKNPWNRGVFCRIRSTDIGEIMTGLYINTNKTADQNKNERERGYTIPWQHEGVLYWLEKLRNWQEKYNPIDGPTPCSELELRHFGNAKSEQQQRNMGAICFLFRDASGKGDDRRKPIPPNNLSYYWHRLLSELEERVAARGQTLSDGSRLRFVRDYGDGYTGSKSVTEFPLHSLRVSLLTCFAMEGQVPMPVLSKLLAGHSRLLMTLYYTKPTPSMMTQAMQDASIKVDASQAHGLRIFLRDAELRQITCKTAYRDEASLGAALANRNPVGWEHRHIGLCLVGGNTVKSAEVGTVGGCWNGGELISRDDVYGPVPNGPENCVRCRWFVTDARYLDALRAQFNNISYRASLAANLAVEHEQARDALLEARYEAQENGSPFMHQHQLEEAERRYEKQIVAADQYAKDLVACFQLIGRLIAIEEGRADDDSSTKLVAVGSMQDIHQPISIIETNSEMLQLAQICEDAELYPDLIDDLRKTPAIEKRSRAINRLLMQNGYSPVFMQMDERMQLIAGNAMLRAMAQQASPRDQLEGFRYAAGAIEAGQHLNLLAGGIEAIQEAFQGPVIKLSELIGTSSKGTRELIHG